MNQPRASRKRQFACNAIALARCKKNRGTSVVWVRTHRKSIGNTPDKHRKPIKKALEKVFGKHLEQDRNKLHKIMMTMDQMVVNEDLFLTANLGNQGESWDWEKIDGTKYPKQINTKDKDGFSYSDIFSFWSLLYSEKNSALLIHPRIQESIRKYCYGFDAPYSISLR